MEELGPAVRETKELALTVRHAVLAGEVKDNVFQRGLGPQALTKPGSIPGLVREGGGVAREVIACLDWKDKQRERRGLKVLQVMQQLHLHFFYKDFLQLVVTFCN